MSWPQHAVAPVRAVKMQMQQRCARRHQGICRRARHQLRAAHAQLVTYTHDELSIPATMSHKHGTPWLAMQTIYL